MSSSEILTPLILVKSLVKEAVGWPGFRPNAKHRPELIPLSPFPTQHLGFLSSDKPMKDYRMAASPSIRIPTSLTSSFLLWSNP